MPRYLLLLTAILAGCSGSTMGPNRAPVAVAGPDQSIMWGEIAFLDGSRSYDPDGDKLTYQWMLVAAPNNSSATLSVEEGVSTELLINTTGVWIVKLVVSDGRLFSEPDVVVVRAHGCLCSNDAACDDNLWCNGEERCVDCFCQAGTAIDCSDGDPCTQDVCNEDLDQCANTPVTDPPEIEGPVGDPTCGDVADNDCDGLTDGDDPGCISCTSDQECADLSDCTADTCVNGSCVNADVLDGTGCDDGLYCTESDDCQQGNCTGAQRDCSSAGGGCTTGVCDEEQDLCVAAPVDDGTGCNDGLYCTENDVCTAGVCSGSARDCSQTAGDCTDASCNEDLNQCEGVPQSDGAPCEDGLYCTVDDQCIGGSCNSGPQRDCGASGGSCVDGSCNEDADQCDAQPVGNGQPCDDGVYCTVDETCQAGSCTGGNERNCPHSLDGCAQGFCNSMTDACDLNPQPDGTTCNDGDPCTIPDQCQGGICQSGPPCPLGCDTPPPRCYEVSPSNVGYNYLCPPGAPDLTLPPNVTVDVDTNSGTVNGNLIPTAQWVWQGSGVREIMVLSFSSITVPQNTTVNVYGWYPLALIACGDIEIHGFINISAWQQGGGPGGYDGGDGNFDTTYASGGDGYDGGGGGGGRREVNSPFRDTSGGGGGFGRAGGDAGQSDPPQYSGWDGGAGGQENGNSSLAPLVGGSGGGGGGARFYGAWGGGGGGAIQITAGGSVLVGSTGGINAAGAGGGVSEVNYFGGGGGGGAGGAILIEGASVRIQGTLAANGGGGGGARTDYWGWNQYCPGGTPQPGEDGPYGDRRAQGGVGCNAGGGYSAGDGGRGGAGGDNDTLGEDGDEEWVGGAGGGAAGRIRVNSFENTNSDSTGSTISPHCSGSTQRCTTGAVSLW